MKTTVLKIIFAGGAILLFGGQTPPASKPGIKVYNAMIPMIDDHLKLVDASSDTPLDIDNRIMVNIVRTPKSLENIGILGEKRITNFYRGALSETYFQAPRVPKPKFSPYVSQFQMKCGGAWSRYDKRADIATACWEDLEVAGTSALPRPRYPLKIQFEFADNELISVNLITEDPNILANADKMQRTDTTVK